MCHPFTVAAEVVRLYINDHSRIRTVLSPFEICQLKMALQRRPVDKSLLREGRIYVDDARIIPGQGLTWKGRRLIAISDFVRILLSFPYHLSLCDLLAAIDAQYAGIPPELIRTWHLSLHKLLKTQRDVSPQATISVDDYCQAAWRLKPLDQASSICTITGQVVQEYLANHCPSSKSCSLITPEAKLKILISAQRIQEGAYTPEDVANCPERELIIDFLSDNSRRLVDMTELEAALLRFRPSSHTRRHSLSNAVSRYFIGVPIDLVETWQHRLTLPQGTLFTHPSFIRQKRALHDVDQNRPASSSNVGTRSRSRSLAEAPIQRKSEPERKRRRRSG